MTQSVAWPHVTRSLVAILRGIKPDEAEAVVDVLIGTGFELIEVPLNSPDPFVSIERLAARFGKDCLIAAVSVGNAPDWARRAEAGVRLMVSPTVDPQVLATAQTHVMVPMPGVFPPT